MTLYETNGSSQPNIRILDAIREEGVERGHRNIKRPTPSVRVIGLVTVAALACGAFACKPPLIEEFRELETSSEAATTFNRESESESVDDESLVLAVVDNYAISLAEFQRRLRALTPLDQRRTSSEASRRQLLEAMVHLHVFAAEAEAAGFADDPLVVQSERAALRDVVLARLVGSELPQASDIGDEEVQRVYDAELFRYQRPDLVRVGLIVSPNRADAVATVTEFRRRLDLDIQTGMELFERLAAEHSIAPPEAAHLGFVSRAELGEITSPEVVEAVFDLINAGQSTDPIPVAGGQAVFYLIERRRALDQGVDEVAETIREQIIDRRRRDAVDETVERLRGETDVEIDRDLLRQLETASAARNPPTQRRPWENLSDLELDREMTPRHDLSFLGDLLRPPPEELPASDVIDGDGSE